MLRVFLVAVLAFLPAASLGAEQLVFHTGSASSAYPTERTVQFRLTVHNPSKDVVTDATVWAYGPVRRTSFQHCLRIKTSHPAELTTDSLGNQILHFSLGALPPKGTRVITVRAHLAMSDAPVRTPAPDLEEFLRPEPLIESDHPEVLSLASELSLATAKDPPRRIHDWVARNLEYAGYLREDRGALYALRERKGDCTEYASLFVALCRAAGVPARSVAGYVVDGDGVLQANEFHNWGEFLEGGTWRVADPQQSRYGDRPSDFLATKIFGRGEADPLGGVHRFICVPEK